MTRLKRFSKNENSKKKIIIGIYAFLIIGIILTGASYAVYQREAEVLFINATVGEFKENDIELAIKLNGEQVDTPPTKDNYTVTVDCDNADGSWDANRWGANVDNIRANKVKCEVNFNTPEPTLSDVIVETDKTNVTLSYTTGGIGISTTCKYGTDTNYGSIADGATNTNCSITGLNIDTMYYYEVCVKNAVGEKCKSGRFLTNPDPISIVEIGDYISMTPTSTSYTPPSSITGYTDTQNTLNPSELNLWRVIRKNEDGTVDAVAEYVSSTSIYFKGQTGFNNLVGTLNTIAAQYTDGKNIISARHMGYSDQPDTCSTCTDSGYTTDENLVKKSIGHLQAKPPGETYYSSYVLASRTSASATHQPVGGTDTTGAGKEYMARVVSSSGSINAGSYLYFKRSASGNYYWSDDYAREYHLRPVVTLKSTAEIINGDGESAETAYQLS